jgi:ubiquinone/menaquinone biosynthesis C-methylase UbiE
MERVYSRGAVPQQLIDAASAVQQKAKKDAVQKFWGTRPCGLIHSTAAPGSAKFFRETEQHRYAIHTDWDQPFLLDAIGFSGHMGKAILEVGCDIGVDSLLWKRAGNQVVSLDFNFPSCQITRDRFRHENQEGAFLNGDAESLPFPKDAFDLIYSFGVLHHTPATDKTIQEIHRCLKPGGQAIVMLYYKWSAKVLGEILFDYGLRRGLLWKYKNVQTLLDHCTEFDSQFEGNVCPLTKVYSKRQIHKMFGMFRTTGIELHYLWPGHFGPLRRVVSLLPKERQRRLHERFGWNAVIKAVK